MVLFLQAPPSESFEVSYTKTSTAVSDIEELILVKVDSPVTLPVTLPVKFPLKVVAVRIPVTLASPVTINSVVPVPMTVFPTVDTPVTLKLDAVSCQ